MSGVGGGLTTDRWELPALVACLASRHFCPASVSEPLGRGSNNPKGRVPRASPWVNELSPEGRREKLVVKEVPRACPWVSTLLLHPKSERATPKVRVL